MPSPSTLVHSMFARRHLGRVIFRRFSTAAEKTTDEKAEEVGQMLWPKFKKYSLIIVPTFLFSVVSIDIINNIYHRHLLEGIFPSFVNLVRDHYGFNDEDQNERKRIQFVKAQLLEVEDVIVQLDGGCDVIELAHVNGEQSSSALEAIIRSKLTKDQTLQFGGMHTVTFKDRSIDSISEPVDSSLSSSIEEDNGQRIEGLPYWQDSLWNNQPLTAEAMRKQQYEYLNLNRPFHYPSAKIVFVRYQSILADMFAGLKKYREFGNDRIDIKGDEIKKKAPAKKTKAVEVNTQKYHALEAIKKIEKQIAQYEYEKRVGSREIDAIEHDIDCKRKEITDIRRKHLNYFYYF